MTVSSEAVYGEPPMELAPSGGTQVSPLLLGAETLELLQRDSLSRMVILAPAGTLERRYAIAQGLRALKPGGEFIVLAPKTRGGARLAAELAAFGCEIQETARRHHRICQTTRPAAPRGVEAAIAEGAPRLVEALGLWSQPGVFSWDRLDPGTALLLEAPGAYAGRGADLGCGLGILARHVLASPAVTDLLCVDIDRRAIEAARRNIDDPRARFLHADVRAGTEAATDKGLDFVIMNPPFHAGGHEDRGLGLTFISAAAARLRRGGVCRMVANVALPYEGRLHAEFASATVIAQAGGFKVYEAIK